MAQLVRLRALTSTAAYYFCVHVAARTWHTHTHTHTRTQCNLAVMLECIKSMKVLNSHLNSAMFCHQTVNVL